MFEIFESFNQYSNTIGNWKFSVKYILDTTFRFSLLSWCFNFHSEQLSIYRVNWRKDWNIEILYLLFLSSIIVSLGRKFFDIELWRTLSLNTYKLSHTLSLHREDYFEYFIRQLRLFSIIYIFLTWVILKIFVLRSYFNSEIRVQRLILLVHFERIGPRLSEKHLTGSFTLSW